MNGSNRRGFTLVELIVVLGMIAVVAGLIIPAVGSVRDSADRIQCTNNLKQVVLATHNIHSALEFVPSNPDTINERHGTTQDFLQPYLE